MKRFFSLALVGLLSISSLAEAKQDTQASAKSKTVQRGPSSAELNCPTDFVKITGSKNVSDFCISQKVEDKSTWNVAKSNCEGKEFSEVNGGKASLCIRDEWILACNKNLPNLGFGSEKEWVANLYFDDGKNPSGSGCESFLSHFGGFGASYGSRCCFRKDK